MRSPDASVFKKEEVITEDIVNINNSNVLDEEARNCSLTKSIVTEHFRLK